MVFVHGKDTYISLDGDDLSEFTSQSDINQTADSHDVTGYGKNSHVFSGGLLGGTASMGGTYADGATGPRAVIQPLLGTVVELIRRPEGTGGSLPQDLVEVLVTGYTESNPVAGMIAWTCSMQLSDDLDNTPQS